MVITFFSTLENEEASRLSGINIKSIKCLVYSLSGFLSGLAELVLLSRINSGQPSGGMGYEMDVITAVVLGGVSISGGRRQSRFCRHWNPFNRFLNKWDDYA